MLDTFALGEQVKKDPKVTLKKKEEVNEHYNSLAARWDRIKDFIALRNERYTTPKLVEFICQEVSSIMLQTICGGMTVRHST